MPRSRNSSGCVDDLARRTGPAGTVAAGYARRAADYLIEYTEERDVPFLLSHVVEGVTDVLEAPCGAGRLTRHLLRKARSVTAIDLEPRMIESVKMLESEGSTTRLHAIITDLVTLDLAARFDLAILPREALQLFEPGAARTVLGNMVAHLKPGGALLVDLATFGEPAGGDPDYFGADADGEAWSHDWTRTLPGGGQISRWSRVQRSLGSVEFTFRYERVAEPQEAEPQEIEHYETEMRLHLYDAGWFLRNLPDDVATISFASSYDGAADLGHSPRLIVKMVRACRHDP
jgi:SAM-dependent methyltransferase